MTGPAPRRRRRPAQRPEAASGPERAHGGRERSAAATERAHPRAGDPQRLAAYTVLRAVADGAYANLELPERAARQAASTGGTPPSPPSSSTARCACTGSTTRSSPCAAGRARVARSTPNVLDALRLGAHQLLGHAGRRRTPRSTRPSAWPARSTAPGAAGFVNAVMRRVSERDLDAWLGRGRARRRRPRRPALAVEQSHPEWIVKALRAALLGHGAATAADRRRRARRPADRRQRARRGAPSSPVPGWPTRRRAGRRRGAEPRRRSRRSAPCSPAATRAAYPRCGRGGPRSRTRARSWSPLALAAAAGRRRRRHRAVARPVRRPGRQGRAARRAGRSRRGADLTADEVSDAPRRAGAADPAPAVARAPGAGRRSTVRTGDGRSIGEDEPGRYDRVLVDAPCTGLGALRRRPEARWRRTPADLADLGKLQCALSHLGDRRHRGRRRHRLRHVQPAPRRDHLRGGRRHRATATDVELPRRPRLRAWGRRRPGRRAGIRQTVQLWPHLHGTDGMFLALLRRTA